MTRTQEEIAARVEAVKDDDTFGFKLEVLIAALDFEHARPYLRAEVTAEEWAKQQLCACDFESEARDYYKFALGKIRDHRGISTTRSVEKLTEFAWLLGRDDVIERTQNLAYEQYGAPKVKAWGEAFGMEWPTEEAMVRMASGLPCVEGCVSGCGS